MILILCVASFKASDEPVCKADNNYWLQQTIERTDNNELIVMFLYFGTAERK